MESVGCLTVSSFSKKSFDGVRHHAYSFPGRPLRDMQKKAEKTTEKGKKNLDSWNCSYYYQRQKVAQRTEAPCLNGPKGKKQNPRVNAAGEKRISCAVRLEGANRRLMRGEKEATKEHSPNLPGLARIQKKHLVGDKRDREPSF